MLKEIIKLILQKNLWMFLKALYFLLVLDTPKDSIFMLKIIEKFKIKIPLLGICLGHQALALSFGANIKKMKEVIHGKTDTIIISKKNKIFESFPNQFLATRYHSLEVEEKNLPKNIEILASTKNKTIMALKVKKYNIYGIQFHPESIASEFGNILFKNFLELCEKGK